MDSKKILVLNMCKYGGNGTHISYVELGKNLDREKYKGYVVCDLWLPNQNWYDVLTSDSCLSIYTINGDQIRYNKWNVSEFVDSEGNVIKLG